MWNKSFDLNPMFLSSCRHILNKRFLRSKTGRNSVFGHSFNLCWPTALFSTSELLTAHSSMLESTFNDSLSMHSFRSWYTPFDMDTASEPRDVIPGRMQVSQYQHTVPFRPPHIQKNLRFSIKLHMHCIKWMLFC